MLTSYVSHDFPVCYVMDGMVLLNKLNPKPTWVKKGADLAAASTSFGNYTHNTTAVIATFDCYRDISLNNGKVNI